MERKQLILRLPKDVWAFMKKQAVDKEMPLNELITVCLTAYKNKCEKKLT